MFNNIIIGYFIFINIIGFIIMGTDKNYAKKHKWRIPERTLWRIALFGGACGTTLGMNFFRHKTQHRNFKWGFPFLGLADLIIFYFLIHI